MSLRGFAIALLACATLAGCGDGRKADPAPAAARDSLPQSSERAGLPRPRPSIVAAAAAGGRTVALRIRVIIEGVVPSDTVVRSGAFDASCGEVMSDHLVDQREGNVAGVLIWIEGPTSIIAAPGAAEKRPTVVYQVCELLPRLQLAAPGSTLQLVMRDERADSLVVWPPMRSTRADTLSFVASGQLVPLRNRADSTGIVSILATRLPWVRAFVAIMPTGSAAITDEDGLARFQLDLAGAAAVVHAWHPSLGALSTSVTPSELGSGDITLTFKR